MDFETLARDAQDVSATTKEAAAVAEQVADIRPVSFDAYKLVGGGSSIVLFD
jgi:hypothetical protein